LLVLRHVAGGLRIFLLQSAGRFRLRI